MLFVIYFRLNINQTNVKYTIIARNLWNLIFFGSQYNVYLDLANFLTQQVVEAIPDKVINPLWLYRHNIWETSGEEN